MTNVRPKKYLGQHFLKDEAIAQKIAASLSLKNAYNRVLEIGGGMGILTRYLLENKNFETYIIEIDHESVMYLKNKFPQLRDKIIEGDFLETELLNFPFPIPPSQPPTSNLLPLGIIGNFPYNISSQILFKILAHRNQIPEVVGMFQKEVAERISSPPGSKAYGILSVFMQCFYRVEYLFAVEETVFLPPPKVKSAVLRFTRNDVIHLGCDEKLFFTVVKTAFNQRRKMLRNALKNLLPENSDIPFLRQRAEELSCRDFEKLTLYIQEKQNA